MIRTDYPDAAACAAGLAGALAGALQTTLDTRPRATLALSGGRSPQTVLPLLAAQPLDWSRVDVTLIDERRVALDDPDSNAGLVRRCFLEAGAAAARFTPLWTGRLALDEALADTNRKLAAILPADIVYLGMGPDGHIASLFPAADETAFERDGFAVISSEAPSAPHGRISLTLSKLIESAKLYLHLNGAAKIQVLEAAATAAPTPALPVSLLLHARPDLDVHACA